MKPLVNIIRKYPLHLIISVLSLSSLLLASTTGKIAGKVTDHETGEPLMGVNVVLVGTELGAATDLDGRYTILNVAPGTRSVTASMIGYNPMTIGNVLVKTDMTSRINFELTEGSLEGEAVTVTAERPMVEADLTSSKAVITSEEIALLPAESFQALLQTKAGVTEGSGGELHIRGGRTSEVLYMIDGIPVINPFSSGLGIGIATSMIQELTLISGTFNAEYGKAMSGIVNLVTKEGADRFSGELITYSGDLFPNENFLNTERAPNFLNLDEIDPLNFTRTDFSLSGPLPIFGGSFLGSASLKGSKGWLYGIREHNTYDVGSFVGDDWQIISTGDNKVVSMNPSQSWNLMGKMTFRPLKTLKLMYQYTGSGGEYQSYSHRFKYNPDGNYHHFYENNMHAFHLTHSLSPKTFYTVKFSQKDSDAAQYVHELKVPYKWDEDINGNGEIDLIGGSISEDLNGNDSLETLTIDWDFLAEYGAFIPNPTWYTLFIDTLWVGDSVAIAVNDTFDIPNYVRPENRTIIPSYHFYFGGTGLGYYMSDSRTQTLKFDLTSQIVHSHELKLGFEAIRYSLHSNDISIELSNRTEDMPYIQSTSATGHDEYTREPVEFAAYFQDKIELKDMVMQLGVRYDYFDSRDSIFTDKEHPADSPKLAATPKWQISPRLGVSFPITDAGYIHFSYGHFFQIPPFKYLYRNPDLEVKSGSLTRIGNPDLKPQKTVIYELGLQQQLSESAAIDITMFYRDIINWLSSEYNFINNSFRYTRYVNEDYGNVRGITAALKVRPGASFSANLDYTFQIAQGNASSPDAKYYDNLSDPPQESEKQVVFLSWDVSHSLNGTLTWRNPGKWGISVINKYSTGLPYTPQYQGQREAEENSGRKPYRFTSDLEMHYFITKWKGAALQFFMKTYNLFDIRNEKYVYNDTGRAGYSLIPTYAGQSLEDHAGEIGVHTLDDYLTRPDYYSQPRQIRVGVKATF